MKNAAIKNAQNYINAYEQFSVPYGVDYLAYVYEIYNPVSGDTIIEVELHKSMNSAFNTETFNTLQDAVNYIKFTLKCDLRKLYFEVVE